MASPTSSKKNIETFSLEKWQQPDPISQKRHSVSECIACAVNHTELQTAIPPKPVFNNENKELNSHGASKNMTEKEFANTLF